MKITVISSPDRRALENELLRLMKQIAPRSENGAVLIVPDQSSFSEEERLINTFGVTGLGNPEVLSFKRLFFRLSAAHPSGRKRLTAPAREMAVMRALSGIEKDEFRLFNGVVKKRELASTVSALITGFKCYGVTAESLKAAEDGLEEGLPLKRKIHDCRRAFEAYEKMMADSGLCDADDDMWELGRILSLKECRFFEGRTVIVRHFSDLNRLQRQCVGRICQRADEVFVAVCWEDKPELATTKKLIDGLRLTAYEYGAEFEHVRLSSAETDQPSALAYLARHYYDAEAPAYNAPVARRIYLHVSQTPFSEVQHLAASVARLVKAGRRYRDITVVTREPDMYLGYIRRIFPIYSIPVFVDEKRPLSRHSVSAYLLSAMELAIHGFTHANVFNFAKNPFAPYGGRCGGLEDYCIEAGVRSWNWSEDFTFIRGAYSAEAEDEESLKARLKEINRRRRELWELIAPLADCLSKQRTGAEYARGLYDFMLQSRLPRSTEQAALQQEADGDLRGAAETRQVYNLMIDILDDICTVFGDTVLPPDELYDAVKTACGAVQIGVVPQTADSVIYGDIERMKGSEDRLVFILGLNEDVFPRSFSNNSIFTDYEAESLSRDFGIELPPSSVAKAENEKLLVYEAVSSASERLYLSYSIGRTDGKTLRPSSVVKRVRRLFPQLRETDDISKSDGEFLCATRAAAFLELGTALGENMNGKFWQLVYSVLRADPEYALKLKKLIDDQNNDPMAVQGLDSDILARVMGGELALSPSALETFASCPFSYFAQNVLRLRDLTPMNINAADSGNLMHSIIDGFCGYVHREKGGSWALVTDDYTEETFAKVAAEVRLGLSRQIAGDPRLGVSIMRIERMARKCIEEIRSQLEDGLFVPTGSEVIIDENGGLSPTKITLPDGRTAKFRGRIDRTDIRKGVEIREDGQLKIVDLVRIVDYKSSGKAISFGKVFNGLQLQLFAYMDSCLSADSSARPAAVLYFNLTEVPVKAPLSGDMPAPEERLTGVAVCGRMAAHKGIAELEAEEMSTVLRYVRRSIRRAAKEIYSGNMPVSPVLIGDTIRCTYCPYGRVCRFDKSGNEGRVRKIPNNECREAIDVMRNELEAEEDEA